MATRARSFYRTQHEFIMAFMANVAKTSATAVTGQQRGRHRHRSGKPNVGIKGDKLAQRVYANMRSVARMIATVSDPKRPHTGWTVKQFVSQTIYLMNRELESADKLKALRSHETGRKYGCPAKDVPKEWDGFMLELQERLEEGDPQELCAWVEYHVRFRIHPLADGSGRLATALAAWVMSRAGCAIPNYAYLQRSDMHAMLRKGFDAFREYYLRVCFVEDPEETKTGTGPLGRAAA